MSDWKRTSCVLCYHNCGLEVQTEGNKIVKVRADKNHPRTKGYMCRKGTRIPFYQSHKERLTHPLKREGNDFKKISWDQAIDEIAAKLKEILKRFMVRVPWLTWAEAARVLTWRQALAGPF